MGDACIIDAGIAILAGTKIAISDDQLELIKKANPTTNFKSGNLFKGSELAGLNGIHYRQDSQNGGLVARRSTREIKLNADLH